MKICHIRTHFLIRKKDTPEKPFSSLPDLKVLRFSAKNLWNEPTFFYFILFLLTFYFTHRYAEENMFLFMSKTKLHLVPTGW